MITACSSDNDEPEQNNSGNKRLQLTVKDVPVTRALLTEKVTNNVTTLGATWKVGDVATCLNLSKLALEDIIYSNLTASSAGETSAFTGTVQMCSQGDMLALIYPKVTPATGTGNFTISLSGQKGTLTDLAERYHYVYGTAEVTNVTETTAEATISEMSSLLAVCKFTFTDGSNPIPVKGLSIGYGTDDTNGYPQYVTVAPAKDASSTVGLTPAELSRTLLNIILDTETNGGVYVALLPVDIQGDFYFSVSGSAGTYIGTAKAKLKAGKFYPVTLTLTKPGN
jgi:hypothetical protein